MNESIRKMGTAALWALVSDVAEIMKQRGYEPKMTDESFIFWYKVYKALETELNRRMMIDYTEG